jgi:hypothetical protein
LRRGPGAGEARETPDTREARGIVAATEDAEP